MSVQIHGLQFQWGPRHHSAIFCSCLSVCQVTTVVSDSLTVDNQAPLSMEFSRQDFWNGLPFPPLGDLPNPRIKPVSLKSPGLAGGFFTADLSEKPLVICCCYSKSLQSCLTLVNCNSPERMVKTSWFSSRHPDYFHLSHLSTNEIASVYKEQVHSMLKIHFHFNISPLDSVKTETVLFSYPSCLSLSPN